MESMNYNDLNNAYPKTDAAAIGKQLSESLAGLHKKIVVLDDDPTGVQTVYGVPVYTGWDQESINQGFRDEAMFFILTNSRSFSEEDAVKANRDIAKAVLAASRQYNREFILVSRGDSTLRGYFPLETNTLRETIEDESAIRYDGEIICPFFPEGGRYTINDIHYVLDGETLTPAGQTEFAKDKSFGYRNSDLKLWVEEKTDGDYRSGEVRSISIEMLRNGGAEAVYYELLKARDFSKVIVNAISYDDIRILCIGFCMACAAGRNYIFRSAAAIPKILGGIADRPLLKRNELRADNRNGGLVVVGSHVDKTSRQLQALHGLEGVEFIEFNQHTVTDAREFSQEILRVKMLADSLLRSGRDTVIYTRRERLDIGTGDAQEELRLSRKISDAVTSFVHDLTLQPAYIIAKGGITSSDIGTKGLGVRRALVLGQVLQGIPVWETGPESKFPGIPYIIFPGNVGGENALREIVEKLRL